MEFKVGDRVVHRYARYLGEGVVKGVDPEQEVVIVHFDKYADRLYSIFDHGIPDGHGFKGHWANVEKVKDMVNSPSHYTQGKVEVIEVIEDATKGMEGIEAVCLGNVIKYTLRANHKGKKLEDLKKAQWYLNRLIGVVEDAEV